MQDEKMRTLINVIIGVALLGIITQLAIENFHLKALRQDKQLANQVKTNTQNVQNVVSFINSQIRQQKPVQPTPAPAE